mgnify:CR=1 FL=1
MLMRGTQKHSRAELKDAFEKLNASVVGRRRRREHRGARREPGRDAAPGRRGAARARLPAAEFEEMKRAALAGAEEQQQRPVGARQRAPRAPPAGLSARAIRSTRRPSRSASSWLTQDHARGRDRAATASCSARPAPTSSRSATSTRRSVTRAGRGAVRRAGRSPTPVRARRRAPLRPRRALEQERAHAGQGERGAARRRQLAHARRRPGLRRRWCSPTTCSAARPAARLPARVREKEGLSYSTFSDAAAPITLSTTPAAFRVSAIFAPQNRARVEQAIREELRARCARGLHRRRGRDAASSACSKQRAAGARAGPRAGRASRRVLLRSAAPSPGTSPSRRSIAALTPAEVNAALKKYVDPSRLAVVAAGDFKKSAASSAGPGSPPAAAPGAAAQQPAAPRPSAGSGG